MKITLTIIWLGTIFASIGAAEFSRIEQLLSENTQDLSDTKMIMSHIDATNNQIKEGLDQQRVWLVAIKNMDELLAKLNKFLDEQSTALLAALNSIGLKSGIYSEKLSKDLAGLVRLQQSTKQQILQLEQKMDAYQQHVIKSSRAIDKSILDLTKLITRAVLPQLNGLQCSFDSLETSQINVEVELKSLGRIKELSEDTNRKLNIVSEQMCTLNRTQDAGLSLLTSAVKQLKPLNAWHIESALRELIISQKRIELDLETCEKRARHQYQEGVGAYAQASESAHQSQQIWTQAKPSQQQSANSGFYASAYASAPQPKPKPGAPSNPSYNVYDAQPARQQHGGHAVSWQEPLPWESASHYQSAPSASPKPNRQPTRKRPTPNPKPCTQPQKPQPYSSNVNQYSAPATYSAPSPAPQSYSQSHQYQQQGAKPGHAISWYSVN